MRIVVDTERDSFIVQGPPDSEAIRVTVRIDGQEDIGLSQILTKAEMHSHFDIIWEHMGKMVKDCHSRGLR